MRCATLVVLLVLAGCSEWSLRSMWRSSALGSDTGDTGPGGPGAPDTAPPDEGGSGGALPTHCKPIDNPPMTPVWDYAEDPSGYPSHDSLFSNGDFDSEGRLLWVGGSQIHAADRSGSMETLPLELEGWGGALRVLPNGKVVITQLHRITTQDPNTGQVYFDLLDPERVHRESGTVEVDTESHLYLRVEQDILRVPATGGPSERILLAPDWDPNGEWRRELDIALTPDEGMLYILGAFSGPSWWDGYRLLRSDKIEGGWKPVEHVWSSPPEVFYRYADVVADECGNALLLMSMTGGEGSELWYVPREGPARRFFHTDDYETYNMQWGSGRLGWDANALYLWVKRHADARFQLHRIVPGMKGNHVLTR